MLRLPNEPFAKDCVNKKVKFAPSVMVWGCMSAQGVGSLYVVDGIMNAEKYRKVFEDHLLPSIPSLSTEYGEFIYQQDGATCHTAKSTMAWLDEKQIPVLAWPSGSPDLSPIETLWGRMKRHLQKNPCATKQALIDELFKIWGCITPEYCSGLVSTMTRRLKDVKIRKGDVTNW